MISYETLQALLNSVSNTKTNKFNLSSPEEGSNNGKLLVDDVQSPLKNL